MSSTPLSFIDWHDLPVSEIRISESGISLFVTPYNEASGAYEFRVLRISDAETLSINVTGSLHANDLSNLEVHSFDYAVAPSGRITGTLGLLPGQAGFWELSFTNAKWELADRQGSLCSELL
jgi:hypothetical protein